MKKLSKLLTALTAVLLAVVALIGCKNEPEVETFSGTAKDLINRVILTEDGTTVASNFTVPGSVTAQNVTVDLTWTADADSTNYISFNKNEDGTYTATINQQDEQVVARFSANLEYNGETASKSFRVRISRIVKPEEVVTNFYDAAKDSAVSITGYIAYLGTYSSQYSNFTMFIVDSNYMGGFYCYRAKATQAVYDQLKVGSAVTVTGTKDIYSQGHQIGSGASVALATDLPDYQAPAVIDVTNDWIADEGDTMLYHTAQYVTLSGMKVTKVNELNTSGSNTQTLLTVERAGKTAALVATGYLYDSVGSANNVAINDVTKTLQVGDYVDFSGYLSNYNGTWQLVCVDATSIKKVEAPATSDVEKVISALNEVSDLVASSYSLPTTITLPEKGEANDTVALSYELGGTYETVSLAEGVLTVTPGDSTEEAVLKVTATLGSTSKVLEIAFSTEKAEVWEVYHEGADNSALVGATGVVYAVGHSKSSGSGTGYALVQDAAGHAYYVYCTSVDHDAWVGHLVVGKTVTMTGTKATYNGKLEFVVSADTFTTQIVVGEDGTLPEAEDITSKLDKLDNTYQGKYVKVVGATVTTEVSGTRTNYYLNVGDSKILFYSDRYFYDTSVTEGLEYTVCGYVNYYNAFQISPVKEGDVVCTTQAGPCTEVKVEAATVEVVAGATSQIKVTTTPALTSDTVTYTSSDTAVATVDEKGVITGVAAGTATITVTCGSASTTVAVTVTAPAAVEYDALMQYAACDTTTNLDKVENMTTALGLDSSVFTVTATPRGSLYPGLNKAGQIRLYGQSTNSTTGELETGNTLTVAVTGKTISKIVINFGSNKNGVLSVTGLAENHTVTGGESITVEYAEGVSSITFANVTEGSTQIYILSVEIYFAE